MRLSLGPSLDPDNMIEGNDVYFDCDIRANPKVYKVIWLHNVSTARPNLCRTLYKQK